MSETVFFFFFLIIFVQEETMTSKELLLRTLEELGDEEFSDFKWYLEQPHNLDGLPFIPKSHLENVKRTETVDKIVQTYNQQSLEVVKKTLTKISRNDLTERLSTISTTAQGKLLENHTCRLVITQDQTGLYG